MESRVISSGKTLGTRPSEVVVCSASKKGEDNSSLESTASGDDRREISDKENPAIVEVLLPLFSKIDLNNDGVISPDELAVALPLLKEHSSGVGNVVVKYLAAAEFTQRGSVTLEDWKRYVDSMAEQGEFPEWLLKSLATVVSDLDLTKQRAAGTSSSDSSAATSKPQRKAWVTDLTDKRSAGSLVDVLLLLFEKADADGDGTISADELAAAAPRLRESSDGSGQVLVSYLQNADSSRRGYVSQDDWERYVMCMTKFTFSDDLLKKISVALQNLDDPAVVSPETEQLPVTSPEPEEQSSVATSQSEQPKRLVRSVTTPAPETPLSPTSKPATGSHESRVSKLMRRPTWSNDFDQDRTPLTDLFIRLFEKIDQDHDGILSVDELAVAVPLLKRQKSGGGSALVHYLEQAGLQKKGFVTMEDWEKYVGCMRSLTLPSELQQAFTHVIDGLDECLAATAKAAQPSTDAPPDSLPELLSKESEQGTLPEEQLAKESVEAGSLQPESELPEAPDTAERGQRGVPTAELRLDSSDKFDPASPQSRAAILECLGMDSDATVRALEGFAGGLNEGVWVLSEPSSGQDLVLKLVKSSRRILTVPTDAENLLRLSKELPGITDDPALAFPLMIIAIIGNNDEKRYDFIIMRKAQGQSLADIIAIKTCFKQLDSLWVIIERLGACLYGFHDRYAGLQHGDFQPSNIFYDDRTEAFTLIDVGGIGVPTVDTDIEHFRKSMNICFSSNGPEFLSTCLERLEKGYSAAAGKPSDTNPG